MIGFRIREAKFEDRDDVLAIHDNVYEGADYLRAKYDYLLSCTNATGYVGIFNEKIVAFIVAFLVDDGQTVITRAGRADTTYKGKGFYSLLKQHAIQQSRAEENSFTAVNSNLSVLSESFQQKHNLVLSREMQRYIFHPNTVELHEGPDECGFPEASKLQQLTNADLLLYMTSSSHKRYLFPHDVIIVDWVPYRQLPSNIPHIMSPTETNMLTNIKQDGGQFNGLLSIATVYKSRDPAFTTHLDIYGSDQRSLKQHIREQIKFTRTVADDNMSLLVYFQETVSQEAVEKTFAEFNIKRSIWTLTSDSKIQYSKQMLFRRRVT